MYSSLLLHALYNSTRIRDRRNRPCIFKTRSAKSKYEGSSGSLRVLSRVLPFILASCIEKSNTMDILLKLLQVSEIITAPQLSDNEVRRISTNPQFHILILNPES